MLTIAKGKIGIAMQICLNMYNARVHSATQTDADGADIATCNAYVFEWIRCDVDITLDVVVDNVWECKIILIKHWYS